MRNNQPVTQRAYTMPEDYRLISSTDTRGVILHCNQQFIEVSGFSAEELVGHNHNIVRHPDMPAAVFRQMWQTLSSGRIWMGLVKNRRKNGDHYWVSAFVTPVLERGQIVGYESVRVPATAAQIQRASVIYERLNRQQPAISRTRHTLAYLRQYAPVWLPGAVASAAVWPLAGAAAAGITMLASLVAVGGTHVAQQRRWQAVLAQNPRGFAEHTVARTYFDVPGDQARAQLMVAGEIARSRTALTRIGDAAGNLQNIADITHAQAMSASSVVTQQNQATQQIASAVTQMSQAIAEVAERVEMNALNARTASGNVEEGNRKAEQALTSIAELKEAVASISQTVQELAQSTSDIGEAASIISTIADQTNLLALNAAIEAARAGEQGRGFAVVADEVRALASKTRQSTDKIHHIIQLLAERSERAVRVSEAGMDAANRGSEIVEATRATLAQINQAVGAIADQSIEMSSAVEEQSKVAEHINQQIVEIADGAKDTQHAAEASLSASRDLGDTVKQVNAVIVRFSDHQARRA